MRGQPWISGCNYIPASAINQIEMWSEETYDPKQIDKELGWAQELGFNTMRVFLSSVVYEARSAGMKKAHRQFPRYLLQAWHSSAVRLLRRLLECRVALWQKQPDPKPGVHNSGWVRDPSMSLRKDTVTLYRNLGKYVKDILSTFRNDKRILLWDLYNEPGNNHLVTSSCPCSRKSLSGLVG